MKISIEAETHDDYEQITKLHTEAFNGDNEAKLVEKLRKTHACMHASLQLIILVDTMFLSNFNGC